MIKTKKLRRHSKKRTKKMINARIKKTRRYNTRRAKKITNTRINTVCLHKNNTRKNKIGGGPKQTWGESLRIKSGKNPDKRLSEYDENYNNKVQAVMPEGAPLLFEYMPPPPSGEISRGPNVPNIGELYSDNDDETLSEPDAASTPYMANDDTQFTGEQSQEALELKTNFQTHFGYNLTDQEIRVLLCLETDNLYQIIRRLHIDRINPDSPLIDPDNFEIALVIHGETDPDSSFDMCSFPNITMKFLAPESMAIAVPILQTNKFGEALRAAFNGELNAFDTFGCSSGKTVLRDMRQGTYNQCKDPPGVKEAMGIYLKLKDGSHIETPIAYFKALYEYYGLTKEPVNNATLSFGDSLAYINQLIQIISNVANGLPRDNAGKKDANIILRQMCCRPYLSGSEISSRMQKLHNIISSLGSPHVEIKGGLITIILDNKSGFALIQQDKTPLPSHSASYEGIKNNSDKFDYTVRRLREIATEIAKREVPIGSTLQQATMKWFRKFVSYYNMINTEFVRRGIHPSSNADILSSLESVSDDVIRSEHPYQVSQQENASQKASSQQSASPTCDETNEGCVWSLNPNHWSSQIRTEDNTGLKLEDVRETLLGVAPKFSLPMSQCSSGAGRNSTAYAAAAEGSYSLPSQDDSQAYTGSIIAKIFAAAISHVNAAASSHVSAAASRPTIIQAWGKQPHVPAAAAAASPPIAQQTFPPYPYLPDASWQGTLPEESSEEFDLGRYLGRNDEQVRADAARGSRKR